ncbi:MAG: Druantia anti-phage system protein DruA [Pseudomonadota bacterium]
MEQVTAIDRKHVQHIRALLAANPQWHRSHLSVELCKLWGWQSPAGQYKDMACRSLLLKLERAGAIVLPPRQGKRTFHSRPAYPRVPHRQETISDHLPGLVPLQITVVSPDREDYQLFNCLLSQYHYLSYRGAVGENLKYLIRDIQGRPLAGLLFGSAAWKTAPRDAFIGWNQKDREGHLRYLTNNMRFLILPWVRVPHLASHILSGIARRISRDWEQKYGHPICLLETFVDRSLFRGICYQAANWILVGQTKGRTRNDRNHDIQTPVKDVYVYPLEKNFRRRLCCL